MSGRTSPFLNILSPFVIIAVFALGMTLEGRIEILAFACILTALSIVLGFSSTVSRLVRQYINPHSFYFLVGGAVAISILPLFQLSTPYLIYVEMRAFVLATTLLALAITLGLTGMVDLGIGAFIGIGAYVAARLSMDAGTPVVLTPLLGAGAAALIAKLLSFIILKARGHYFALATLGLGLVAYHLFIQASPLTGGVDGIRNIPGVNLLGITSLQPLKLGSLDLPYQVISYYWVLLCFLLVFFFVIRVGSGQFGRCLRAVRDNEAAAVGSGIKVSLHRSWAYTIAGAIAGFSGALHAHTVNYIAPGDFDLQASVFYLTLAVLGGLGKPLPLVASALGIVFLEEKLRELGNFRMLLIAVALLSIVLYRARVSQGDAIFTRNT